MIQKLLDFIRYEILFSYSVILIIFFILVSINFDVLYLFALLVAFTVFLFINSTKINVICFLILMSASILVVQIKISTHEEFSRNFNFCQHEQCRLILAVETPFSCKNSICTAKVNVNSINSKAVELKMQMKVHSSQSVVLEKSNMVEVYSKLDIVDFMDSEEDYLKWNGISAVIAYPKTLVKVNNNSKITLENKSRSFDFLLRYRNYLIVESAKYLKGNSSALAGIVLGDKTFYEQNISQIRLLGISHIFVVSGFNLSVVYLALYSLRKYIGINKVRILGIIFAIVFTLIVGIENISALRAMIMLLIILLLGNIGYKINKLSLIAFSILILCFFDIYSVFSVSTYLTYAALIGVIYFTEDFSRFCSKFFPSFISSILGASISAFLFTAPIIIFYFKEISLFSIISSIFVSVLIEIITVMGVIFYIILPIPIIREVLGLFLSSYLDLFLGINSILINFGFSLQADYLYLLIFLLIDLILIVRKIFIYLKS